VAVNDEAEQRKQTLLRLLSEASAESARIEEATREANQAAHFSGEAARAEHDVVACTPAENLPEQEVRYRLQVWGGWKDEAVKYGEQVVAFSADFVATSYAVTSSSNTVIFSSEWSSLTPEVQSAQARMVRVWDRIPLVEKARAEMQRLGLDRPRPASRSALDLLNEAALSFGGGATAVLIPVREAINTAVEQLLLRRPVREPAGGHYGKVVSLGKQCARPNLALSQIENLGRDQEQLIRELSEAKDKSLSHREVSDLFHRAVFHLDALLGGLDENRLKPHKT
jgi:hypothetical protein